MAKLECKGVSTAVILWVLVCVELACSETAKNCMYTIVTEVLGWLFGHSNDARYSPQ